MFIIRAFTLKRTQDVMFEVQHSLNQGMQLRCKENSA